MRSALTIQVVSHFIIKKRNLRFGKLQSGLLGVRQNKQNGSKWETRVMPKRILSSQFETKEAAARAYDRGTIAMHGREKAALNYPLEDYDIKVSSF